MSAEKKVLSNAGILVVLNKGPNLPKFIDLFVQSGQNLLTFYILKYTQGIIFL